LWRRAERGFDADTVAAAAAALDKAGERLAADLAERDWLAGEAFTLADAAVFPHAIQFEALGHAPPEPVARWLTRVGERPAVAALDKEFFPIATMGPEPARWG
jgi:glutathione S-transferase